jgi:hypothetical protein
MKEKTEKAGPEAKTDPAGPVITTEPTVEQAGPEKAKQEGVKVTKGGISKIVDPSQVAAFKANGWK